MTPEVRTDPVAPAAANGTYREADFLARARRVLAGDVRPDDYLPVTPEVRRAVDGAMAYYRERGKGQALAPEVEPWQLQNELLSFHYGGENIVYTELPDGVVVLAVGLEQMKEVLTTLGPTAGPRLCIDVPLPWK